MPYIPPTVDESLFSHTLVGAGLTRIHQGKVRDTYQLLDQPDLLLVVATDRVSIFDFVLGAPVERKGEVLTALTIYFLTRVLDEYDHHLVSFGVHIDPYLPASLRGYHKLQRRALIVKKRAMMPIECVVRGVLTGSAWEKYAAGKRVLWGYQLPDNLYDGAWLDQPMFTPTDKAESGHDEPVTREFVDRTYGQAVEDFSIMIFKEIREHARHKGIIFADTKFEFDAGLMICDEVATPDSSRYWDAEDYEEAQRQGKAPVGYDKQPVREWGKTAQALDGKVYHIGKLDAKSKDDHVLVGKIPVPTEVLSACQDRYLQLTERMTGLELPNFQRYVMHIPL